MTKEQFLTAYREQLKATYAWARDDAAKLERFMASVRNTISHGVSTWVHDGEAVTAAWRAIGGKGKPTLKALRALPDWSGSPCPSDPDNFWIDDVTGERKPAQV
jgi:hypothetical protein